MISVARRALGGSPLGMPGTGSIIVLVPHAVADSDQGRQARLCRPRATDGNQDDRDTNKSRHGVRVASPAPHTVDQVSLSTCPAIISLALFQSSSLPNICENNRIPVSLSRSGNLRATTCRCSS